jgi:hypothetical protein
MYHANCFIGMFADASPSFNVTIEIGPFRSFVRCVYWITPLPELNVMNRRGSLMKLTPVLKSCPRPPIPETLHEKSSRNCHFFCSVVCGVLGLCPTLTEFWNNSYGSWLFAPM